MRLRGIASASKLFSLARATGHVAAVGWEGSVRGRSLSLPDAAPPSQHGPGAHVSSWSESSQPSDLRSTSNRECWSWGWLVANDSPMADRLRALLAACDAYFRLFLVRNEDIWFKSKKKSERIFGCRCSVMRTMPLLAGASWI
jgi:hypothetical protein